MLTTDYKILTKALANRLQQVLPEIIHTDQTASIRGRTINDNTRLLHDAIYYANAENLPLAVVSVDQMKAFDRVSREFLFECLDRFGFGPIFTQRIKVLYNSVSSAVKTNGWLTSFIQLQRGFKTGVSLGYAIIRVNCRDNGYLHPIKSGYSWVVSPGF